MLTKETKIKTFENELGYISTPRYRKFAEEVLGEANEYFFIYPASSTGKHHPQFARGIFGLALHTKAVAYYTKMMIELYNNIPKDEEDLAIIAAIFHDIKKYGNNESSTHTISPHGRPSADFVKGINNNISDKEGKLTSEEMGIVYNAIAHHMGRFENESFNNKIEKYVSLADATASFDRTKFSFSKGECDHLYGRVLQEHTLAFGKKYAGTVVSEIDNGYFQFICNPDNNTDKKISILNIISEAVLRQRGLLK